MIDMKDLYDSTFSITAFCPRTGDLGVAISTAALAVGRRCPHVKLGVGAIATQARTNIELGIKGLKLMELGISCEGAMRVLLEEDELRENRQIGAVDAQSRCYGWTGSKCNEYASHIVGKDFVVAGNTLFEETIPAMANAFETSKGELSERLLFSLEAGQDAGGDQRGRISAALLVASEKPKRYHNIRVDEHADPVTELRRIYNLAADKN